VSALFVTGIDTGCGKTVVTGLLARHLARRGASVVTQKLVQTGSGAPAEDIVAHRRLMGVPLLDVDRDGTTCPYVFPYPASPQLAAHLAGSEVDPALLLRATASLAARYDRVLVEGVGGACVPLRRGLTVVDLVAAARWPVVVVATARLGSLNHTLLTLEALAHRGLQVRGIVLNRADAAPAPILADARQVFREALVAHGWRGVLVEVPAAVDPDAPPEVDFSPLLDGE
jgi:dethiobiotin synthetase